jgi:cytochrome c biogenesis protein ResB
MFEQPMIKELLRIGSQFIGYREYATRAEGNDFYTCCFSLVFYSCCLSLFLIFLLSLFHISTEKLAEANKRAETLARKLEQSETARKKAELAASEARAEADDAKAKAASVEELQQRLKDAESALHEQKSAQAAREQGIIKRLKSQSRRTLSNILNFFYFVAFPVS